jgi:hypothetical protein
MKILPSALMSHLTWGFLVCPNLVNELCEILAAIDGDEFINTDSISNDFKRKYLSKLFEIIPQLEYTKKVGWCRSDLTFSCRECIINTLMQYNCVFEEKKLSTVDLKLLKNAIPRLLLILTEDSEALHRLHNILKQLKDNGIASLEVFDSDDEIQSDIIKLFGSLGFDIDGNGDCKIPSGVYRDDAVYIVDIIVNMFHIADSYQPFENEEKKQTIESSNDSDNDSPSDDSTDDSNEIDIDATDGNKVKGPSLPTASQLEHAQKLAHVSGNAYSSLL